MTDEHATPNDGRVSFAKRGAGPTRPALGGRTRKGNLAADGSPMPPPPPFVRYAALAIVVSGVAALIASLSLFGLKGWLFRSAVKANNKKKVADRETVTQLHHAVNSTTVSSLVSTIVLLLALGIAARGVLRGRSWARWTVIALWVLATFTGTFASFTYLVGVASDEPIGFKIPSFISAISLIAAVILVSLRPSAEYFALTKAPRPGAVAGPGGVAPRRPGLFGPRPARPTATPADGRRSSASRTATTRPATKAAAERESTAERGRAKQRASTESVAKGAELARARAKASKSRRTGV